VARLKFHYSAFITERYPADSLFQDFCIFPAEKFSCQYSVDDQAQPGYTDHKYLEPVHPLNTISERKIAKGKHGYDKGRNKNPSDDFAQAGFIIKRKTNKQK
jgi:hypothetical protein